MQVLSDSFRWYRCYKLFKLSKRHAIHNVMIQILTSAFLTEKTNKKDKQRNKTTE